MTLRGISRDSRLVVTRLGLGTASRPRKLARYRSGVRFPDARQVVALLRVIKFSSVKFYDSTGNRTRI